MQDLGLRRALRRLLDGLDDVDYQVGKLSAKYEAHADEEDEFQLDLPDVGADTSMWAEDAPALVEMVRQLPVGCDDGW